MIQNIIWVYFLFWDTLFKEISFLCLWGLYFLKWDVNKNSYLWSSIYNESFSPGSGCFYHYLSITGFHWFDYMSWCGFLCVYFVWACWASWICEFIVHNKFWKIWPLYLNIFSAPFLFSVWDFNYTYIQSVDIVSHTEALLIFLVFFPLPPLYLSLGNKLHYEITYYLNHVIIWHNYHYNYTFAIWWSNCISLLWLP